MGDAIIGLAGALIGGLAAVVGAGLQARNALSVQAKQLKAEERRRRDEEAERLRELRRALVRRYLFQLDEAIHSLRHRLRNWTQEGGQEWTARRPGYWEVTSLYVFARALAAERLLALEGVYPELDALWAESDVRLTPRAVEQALDEALGQEFFYYERLALAEAVLDRADEGFRLLIYSEFRRRYDDQAWNALLDPAHEALGSLTAGQLEKLEASLGRLSDQIKDVTRSES